MSARDPSHPPLGERPRLLGKAFAGWLAVNIIVPGVLAWLVLPPLFAAALGFLIFVCVAAWAFRWGPYLTVALIAVGVAVNVSAYIVTRSYEISYVMCDGVGMLAKNQNNLLHRYKIGIQYQNDTGRDIWILPIEATFSMGIGRQEQYIPNVRPQRIPAGNNTLTIWRQVTFDGVAPAIDALPPGQVRIVTKYGLTEKDLSKTLTFSGEVSPIFLPGGDTQIGFTPDVDSDISAKPKEKCHLQVD